jgi:outer membrane receptor protein involved in Fe transport
MKSRPDHRLLSSASLFTLAIFAASPALSQDAASQEEKVTVLQPVIVTGEKVARDLKNTASSVSIKTGREIAKEKTGDATVSEVIADTPNIVYPDTVTAPIIRGQDSQGPNTGATAFFAGTVPRASISVDGHYLSYNEFIYGATSVWDLDSVEVFRGPQTTSQGANAIAGAIVVNTKDPTFTPEGAYQAEIGSYGTKRGSVALSGPLVSDELAARLAIDYSGRDTFIDYINNNFKQAGTDQEFMEFNARAKFLWEPSEIPGLSTKLTLSHNTSNRPSQESATAPYDDLNSTAPTMPSWAQHTNTAILDISYDFENGVKFFNKSQYSATKAERRVGVVNSGDADIDAQNFSEELRATFGEQDDTWSGVVGVFYNHTVADEYLEFSGISTFDDKKDNFGIYGETTYRLDEQWSVTGGVRFQRDTIQRYGVSSLASESADFDTTFSEFLPKASISYAVNDEWTVGALISRGYNPGGLSLNLTSKKFEDFDKETLWNYELFTRANLLDDRLMLTGNLFYMDMKNAQYNVAVEENGTTIGSYTINAEAAHAYGLEIGANYMVLDNLTIKTSAGLLKTEIEKMSTKTSYEGNEFAKSPGYMLSFGASWDATDKLNLSGQVRHLDGYYSDIANTSDYIIKPYTIADVRASYQFRPEVEVYAYVKNIFDERAPTHMKANRAAGGTEASMTTPRMFGFGVKGSF